MKHHRRNETAKKGIEVVIFGSRSKRLRIDFKYKKAK